MVLQLIIIQNLRLNPSDRPKINNNFPVHFLWACFVKVQTIIFGHEHHSTIVSFLVYLFLPYTVNVKLPILPILETIQKVPLLFAYISSKIL